MPCNMKRNCLTKLSLLLLTTLVACSSEIQKEEAEPQLTEALKAALAKADAFDGEEDKIVSNCITCNLRMSGDEAYPSKLGDYTLHLCKEGCHERFESDKEKAVNAVEYP